MTRKPKHGALLPVFLGSRLTAHAGALSPALYTLSSHAPASYPKFLVAEFGRFLKTSEGCL